MRASFHSAVDALHRRRVQVTESVDRVFMIMECAEGTDLLGFILDTVKQNRKLTGSAGCGVGEATACNLFHDIVSGVVSLHVCGVVHRDMKPGTCAEPELRE
jgi:serine/threonine protein kinase